MLKLVEVDLTKLCIYMRCVYLCVCVCVCVCVGGGGGGVGIGIWTLVIFLYFIHVQGCPKAREHIENH